MVRAWAKTCCGGDGDKKKAMLDLAKSAVETLVKVRQRSPESRGDRYMLLTFEDPPQNIKAGWKENLATLTNELKNLQGVGWTTLGAALKHALDVLSINRMQTGMDTCGQGRCPYLEPSVIVVITEGGKYTTNSGVHQDFTLPMHSPIPGSELTKEPFKWDQRFLFGAAFIGDTSR
ncbi:integrator complex subunit 6-A-like [Temnothorax americanus]|uniref:integrator complex subunit 6-A-like n=1 Tax=Temnothorax americanus TaxID=1964332 RepID=UPI0040686910